MSDAPWTFISPEVTGHKIGMTCYQPAVVPEGFRLVDVERIVGRGRSAFERAAHGLVHWEMHRRSGLKVLTDHEHECKPGDHVTLQARIGPWGLLPVKASCIVVGRVSRPLEVGLAYATLPGHPERGEQSFVLRYQPKDDTVHARICSVSQPGSLLSRMAGPLARAEQDRVLHRYLEALRDLAA